MRKQMSWLRLVLLCVLLVIAYSLGQDRIEQREKQLAAQETELRIDMAALQADARELERQINVVGTDVYVIGEARANYDYVRKGEMRFAFLNPGELARYSEEEARILAHEMSID